MNTLNSVSNERVVSLELNQPQADVNMVRANTTVLLWGRGTGKTVGGIAPWMKRISDAMPGHLGGIFGQTYTQLETNIIPKIMLGLNELGLIDGVDYVRGKKPPETFLKCRYPINKFERTICFPNGTTFQMIGLKEKGSPNAFDFQSGIFDEAKYFDPQQLEDEVYPTFRGFEDIFGQSPEYLSKIFATDKMGDYLKLKWLLDMRKKMNNDAVQTILEIEEKIVELQMHVDDANSHQRDKLLRTIYLLNLKANNLRRDLVHVSEASALENIHNLGVRWLADKKARMTPYVFNVAILNQDPQQSQNGFYHALSPLNYYTTPYANADYDTTRPLIISMDYQHSIAPLCVAQVNDKVNKTRQLNFINEFYTLYPAGIVEAINLFANYYKPLGLTKVYYVFDQTAKGKRAGAEPLFKLVINTLRKHKISVTEIYMGDTPDHFDKYQHINAAFAGEKWLPVMINEATCIKTKVSMQGAATKSVGGVTKKDKEYENAGKYPSIDQSETTHFSDTSDQTIWATIEQRLVPISTGTTGIPLR